MAVSKETFDIKKKKNVIVQKIGLFEFSAE